VSFVKQKEFAIVVFVLPLLFLLLNYYTGVADPVAKELVGWGQTLWNFSMLIATLTMFKQFGTNMIQRKKDSEYSAILFVAFFAYLACLYAFPAGYDYILTNYQTPLSMGLLVGTFNTYTLLFRGARTRNWLGVLLLVSSILFALHLIPIAVRTWSGFDIIGAWINDIPNAGVMRAITITMGVGLVATLVREVTGKETHYLGA
jgi:hypothetical protein